MPTQLTEQDYQRAARALGCEVAAIKAVAKVEAPGSGFLPTGEPRILFERHKFHKHTGGKYDKSHPGISAPSWGGYGKESAQHGRLQEASALDRDAALKSASWGRFQILGENYRQAGFDTLQAFINAMYESESAQLDAFVNFIKDDSRLAWAIKSRDWVTFASIYNGPKYRENAYHTKLEKAYKDFAA